MFLLGCAPPDDADAPAASGNPDASWVYEGELAEPAWTAEEAGAALQAAVALPFPVPLDLFQTFADVMANGDDGCPGPELTFEAILGCTADSGWFYSGIAGYNPRDLPEVIQDSLYADMQVIAPDGARFAIGGSAFQQLGATPEGQPTYTGVLEGIFIYTNGSAFDPAVDALIDYTAGERADGGPRVGLDGAIGFGGNFLMFDDAVIGSVTCQDNLTGTVRIRDTTEHWYSVAFGDDCDGCGTVYFNGTEDIGTTCVSFEQLGNNLATTLLEPWR